MQVQEEENIAKWIIRMMKSRSTFGAWLRMHEFEKDGHYRGDPDWIQFWSGVNSILKLNNSKK